MSEMIDVLLVLGFVIIIVGNVLSGKPLRSIRRPDDDDLPVFPLMTETSAPSHLRYREEDESHHRYRDDE